MITELDLLTMNKKELKNYLETLKMKRALKKVKKEFHEKRVRNYFDNLKIAG